MAVVRWSSAAWRMRERRQRTVAGERVCTESEALFTALTQVDAVDVVRTRDAVRRTLCAQHRSLTNCCTNGSDTTHRCCHLPNKVENFAAHVGHFIYLTMGWKMPQNCPLFWEEGNPPPPIWNMVRWSHTVHTQNGTSIGSSIFVGFTVGLIKMFFYNFYSELTRTGGASVCMWMWRCKRYGQRGIHAPVYSHWIGLLCPADRHTDHATSVTIGRIHSLRAFNVDW